MACEIAIGGILCDKDSSSRCIDCRAAICESHVIKCDVCLLPVCSDCLIKHQAEHETIEGEIQKQRSRF